MMIWGARTAHPQTMLKERKSRKTKLGRRVGLWGLTAVRAALVDEPGR